MSQRDRDLRPLPGDDFRERRAYLADEVFYGVPGSGVSATDRVTAETWRSLLSLPTDVLLRTTDYQGSLLGDCVCQANAWAHATPLEPKNSHYMFEPAMDAGDDFAVAPFVAAHGWYRQGSTLLRTALEVMTERAAYATTLSANEYDSWRSGERDLNFQLSLSKLRKHHRVDVVDYKSGVLGRLYRLLSNFAHGRPGSTNADIWKSNGPVWVADGFRDFWLTYCDTVAACYLLLKIGWPILELPDEARPLFGPPSPLWGDVGPTVLTESFN